MFKVEVVKKLIVENVERKGNPLGISTSKLKNWGNFLPTDGEYLFFTGLTYQMMPYLEIMITFMEKIEETPLEKTIELANKLSSLFNLIYPKKIEYYNGILRKIAELLRKCGIDVYYNPNLDFYSGIFLYDFDEKMFEEYIERYSGIIEGRKIVTLDPHTTYALKSFNANIEVYSYLELLGKINLENLGLKAKYNKVTLHDPCYYARYLDIIEEPRRILNKIGIESVDIRNSGKLTACCGAPVESISPSLSRRIAENRTNELKKTGCTILTLCPICLARLGKNNQIKDFVEVIEL
ncbi:(Fe-S)-binding protein [Archaeoglobales archaeon]|mgnify:CR=1 FL=1|nr:MAG: (Fe-S)-binding protein [Archaeoglobales archaeon]